MLLSRGADPSLQCRWTEMTALHYSAYFDIPQVVRLLLDSSGGTNDQLAPFFYFRGKQMERERIQGISDV